MKNLIAIETSSPACIVAGCNSTGAVVERVSADSQSHNEDLLTLIDQVLKDLKIGLADLDAMVIGIGPGSFTGLRIGLALVKGLVSGISPRIPVYPVSSLLAFAIPVLHENESALVLSVADARRGEFFSAAYRLSATGIQVVLDEQIRSMIEIQDGVSSVTVTGEILGTGPAATALSIEGIRTVESQDVGSGLVRFIGAGNCQEKMVLAEELYELEPSYIRLVAARTIAERAQMGS